MSFVTQDNWPAAREIASSRCLGQTNTVSRRASSHDINERAPSPFHLPVLPGGVSVCHGSNPPARTENGTGEWVDGIYLLAFSFSASFSSSVLTVVKLDSSLLLSNTIVSSQ